MATFGTKLRDLRKSHNLSLEKLAQNLNTKYQTKISKSMISRWENGTVDPQMTYVSYLADYFNTDFKKLIDDNNYDTSNISNIESLTSSNMIGVRIPLLGEIACGEPITAEENIEDYITETFNAGDVPSGTLFALKAKGNSMQPTIPNGATVLIREQPDVEDGEIAAVLVNNDTEATLKRVKHMGDMVILQPDNRDYDAIPLTKDNPGRIIGKAIKVEYPL